jgi:hypothetical protein
MITASPMLFWTGDTVLASQSLDPYDAGLNRVDVGQ